MSDSLNGYVCFWKEKRCEVKAKSTYDAQQEATDVFQKEAGRRRVKSYDIEVVLAGQSGCPPMQEDARGPAARARYLYLIPHT